MRCQIPAENVKVFARGLHALAKIGEDVWIGTRDGLDLRTINSARSAFASFFFAREFFSAFDGGVGEGVYKVAMKSVLWVFKSISQLEKTVETASIATGDDNDHISFKLNCKFGVVKTFKISLLEGEELKSSHNSSSSSHRFEASSKLLNEAAMNFLSNQEEVTMVASPEEFIIKNYEEEDNTESAKVHTVLSMKPGEFKSYQVMDVNGVQQLTFCLKELRAFIGFADSFLLSVCASFNSGGAPIAFSVCWPHIVEATLVMATLNDNAGDPPSSTMSTTVSSEDQEMKDLSSTQNEVRMDSQDQLDASCRIRSPPAKAAHLIFRRCFDATFDPATISGAHRVLAPDSDEEK